MAENETAEMIKLRIKMKKQNNDSVLKGCWFVAPRKQLLTTKTRYESDKYVSNKIVVFRTLLNIYDGALLQQYLTTKLLTIFFKKRLSWMFDRVLNTTLMKFPPNDFLCKSQ